METLDFRYYRRSLIDSCDSLGDWIIEIGSGSIVTDSSTYTEGTSSLKGTINSSGSTIKASSTFFSVDFTGRKSLLVDMKGSDELPVTSYLKDNYGTEVYSYNKGLVLYLPLDEGSGTIAYDRSYLGNDGVLLPNDPPNTLPPDWVNGRFNKALSFDGSDDRVNCGHSSILDITTEITVGAWVKLENTAYYQDIVTKRDPSPQLWGLIVDSNGKLWIGLSQGGTWRQVGPQINTISWNKWHHIAFTFSSIDQKVTEYVDGQSAECANTYGDIDTSNADVIIGWGYGSEWTKGIIDEVRIYNRALTREEVLEVYEAGKLEVNKIDSNWNRLRFPLDEFFRDKTSLDGLVLALSLDEGQGNYVFDKSDKDNDGVLKPDSGSVSNEIFTSDYDTPVQLGHDNLTSGSEEVTTTDGGTTFTVDTDYTMNYTEGKITVLSTGSMADNTTYYIDYDFSGSVPSWTNGKFIKALSFDGIDDFVEVPDSTSLDITDEITITAWVKLDVLPSSKGPFTEFTILSKENAYRIYISGLDDYLHFAIDCENYSLGDKAIATITAGDWYHFAFTYQATEGRYRLYVNGDLKNDNTSAAGKITTNSNPVLLGKVGTNFLDGTIDEVRLYNQALTKAEIKQIYESGSLLKLSEVSKISFELSHASTISPTTIWWDNLNKDELTFDNTEIESLSVERTLTEQIGKIEMVLDNENRDIKEGDAYELRIDDYFISSGEIEKVDEVFNLPDVDLKISGRDWGLLLFTQKVTKSYTSKLGEEVIDEILGSISKSNLPYPNERKITSEIGNGHIESSGLEIDIDFEDLTLFEALRKTCSYLDFDFFLSPEKDFKAFPKDSKDSGVVYDEDSLDAYEYSKTSSYIKNRILILGAKGAEILTPSDKDGWTEYTNPSGNNWTLEAQDSTGSTIPSTLTGDSQNPIAGTLDVKASANTIELMLERFQIPIPSQIEGSQELDFYLKVSDQEQFFGEFRLEKDENNYYKRSLSLSESWKPFYLDITEDQWTKVGTLSFNDISYLKWRFECLLTPIRFGEITFGHSIFDSVTTERDFQSYIDQLYFKGGRVAGFQEDIPSQTTFGLRQPPVFYDETITSSEEAQQIANYIINKYKNPILSIDNIKTDVISPSLVPGYLLTLRTAKEGALVFDPEIFNEDIFLAGIETWKYKIVDINFDITEDFDLRGKFTLAFLPKDLVTEVRELGERIGKIERRKV